jgi:hypothetical protein
MPADTSFETWPFESPLCATYWDWVIIGSTFGCLDDPPDEFAHLEERARRLGK